MPKKVQENQLNRIIKYYTLTTGLLVLVLPLFVSAAVFGQRQETRLADMAQIVRSTVMELNDQFSEVHQLAYSLTSTREWELELYRYFDLTYSQHWTYYLTSTTKDEFLPKEIYGMYQYNDDLKAVQIILSGRKNVYESTRTSRYGEKVDTLSTLEGIHFIQPLRSMSTNDTIGSLQMTFSFEMVKEQMVNESHKGILMVYDDPSQKLIGSDRFGLANQKMSQEDLDRQIDLWEREYLSVVEPLQTGHQVIFLYAKKDVLLNVIPVTLLIVFICVLMAGSILFVILRQLRRYAGQVNDILEGASRIEQGQLYYRISQANKDGELLEITQAINAMLDGQQAVMKQVYQLQSKHAQAVLKALQAQINPHFLYNTLEFIRMSAYVDGSESLSDFVYDFSSLLRNTITDEKEASLKSEISFIKKYVHLYQARYPDKLTLKIDLDSSVENFMVPKFTFQPLIENYLVHGVDFVRDDNIVSIQIKDLANGVYILIEDNGRGISEKKVSDLNTRLRMILSSPFDWEEAHTSLGINLVAQRLGQKFGQNIQMYYENRSEGGVRIWIKLKKNM